ncbi:hypothetical protein N657DRAFT_674258 [Parathielavia appendiculata]|uniref:Yeast cell wall synthesis Kre9/Knh1-like N-terminal domain-containing protein n=1 Tax=Parathielavia appendiculata TaxID=2587402 RepID=A0AAN6TUP8_9PEZI|nr:hypothetical protein N657DRAFT_674258 [Parathielavia appendiculata]
MMIKTVLWALLLACTHNIGVLAAVTFTNTEYYIYAGSPFTVTWTGNRAPITLTLMNGPDENLQTVLTIVSDYSGQDYTWTPPAELPADSYILRLEDGGSTDYSARFRYPSPPLSSGTTTIRGSTTTTPPSSAFPSVTTSPAPAPSDPSSSPSEIFSTPAKAIIAALGSLLLLALIALLTYCVAYRRQKQRRDREKKAAEAASFGGGSLVDADGHELMPAPLLTSRSAGLECGDLGGYSSYHHDALAMSPDTVIGSSQMVHMKVDGAAAVYPLQGQGQLGGNYGRVPAELGGRDMIELSAEGEYLK